MKLWIFNVGHGSCACLITQRREVVFFDAGRGGPEGFDPAEWARRVGISTIDHLIISHFDEDHVAGVRSLAETANIRNVHFNDSLDLRQVAEKKASDGQLTETMLFSLELANYMGQGRDPLGPGISLFRNRYPLFTNQNDLSLVAFVQFAGVNVAFPGDIERQGWARLLRSEEVVAGLRSCDVFVASHHGRENGYHPALRSLLYPHLVIVSDGPKQFETQEFDYASHAKGVDFTDGRRRRVLTTRADGCITLEPWPTGAWVEIGPTYHPSRYAVPV